MPIRVQNDLPVKEILEQENIFVMDEMRAAHQDIRPISIGLLNLMPLKMCIRDRQRCSDWAILKGNMGFGMRSAVICIRQEEYIVIRIRSLLEQEVIICLCF